MTASYFHTGPVCAGEKCTHPDHQVGGPDEVDLTGVVADFEAAHGPGSWERYVQESWQHLKAKLPELDLPPHAGCDCSDCQRHGRNFSSNEGAPQ